MTTIVNSPGTGENSSGALGVIIGILVVVILAILFYIYVLPSMRSQPAEQDSVNVNIELPAGQSGEQSPK